MDSNALVSDYDVFLNFRGKDTRQGFIDVIYEYMTSANIRVFRDDDELAIGDKIESILEAIDSSKICIPIFSPKFAQSTWCLGEVARMVELKKTIVPIFYKVSSDDVELKETSVYADDFKKLEQNHGDPAEIDNWKNALKKAASISGRELGDKRYTQFCKQLVNEVLSKLGPRKKLDVDQFVGDTNKATAIRLLNMGSSSQQVVYLGIHGMGGIGKTTLSKLIYNEFLSSFDYCGFLSDIREFSANTGVDGLPTYLFDNLQPEFVTPFSQSEQIPNLFKNKKVLLILDDVDSYEQITKIAGDPSWFGLGSRIILTSRDKKVFKDFKSVSRCDIQYLEMKELERGWSLELFSRCVFGNTSPPSSYLDLSERVVAYTGGFPLTIIVIAKYLRNQEKVVWEEIIERLKKTPPKEVNSRFIISRYDPLEDQQNWYGSSHILMSKNLKVLNLSSCQEIRRTPTFLENMHLERLNLSNCKLLEYVNPSIGKLRHLTVLNLSGGKRSGNKLKNLPDSISRLEKLECLNLNYTRFLVELPESLGNLHSLRELNLVESGLARLPDSIIKLEKLEKLDLSYCRMLRELPNLPSSLKVLRIECGGLKNNVPDLSNLQDLTSLWIGGAKFNLLGSVIGLLSMSRLLDLTLDECDAITDIPIGEMQSLTSLTIRGCPSLVSLVNLDKLKKLRKLRLSECPCLAGIPGVGKLRILTKLSVLECDSLELIEDITGLDELKVLRLIGCQKLTRVPGLVNLKSLSSLVVKGCQSREILEVASQLEELHGVVDYSEEDDSEEGHSEEYNNDDDDDDDDLEGGLAS